MTQGLPTESEAQRFAARLSEGVRALAEYARTEITPIFLQATSTLPGAHHVTVYGLFGRVSGWLSTIATLAQHGGGASDFQAYQSAARALLELTVDLAFLAYPTADPFARMEAWERSARLKHAECTARYRTLHPRATSDGTIQAAFIATHQATIQAERLKYWGKANEHPNRWTARDLLTDAREADKLAPGLRLEEYYETLYRYICWNVHGSSLAGVRGLGNAAIQGVCGFSFYLCGHFGIASTELALRAAAWNTASQKLVHEMHERFIFGYAGVRVKIDEATGAEYLEPISDPKRPLE
ncbi:MAG TPA: DUF5677 domain-containing protein [Polyangiaceae bacterium]|nr:DUF5677 domain-containing protein [Polyangiaceae bacterium]